MAMISSPLYPHLYLRHSHLVSPNTALISQTKGWANCHTGHPNYILEDWVMWPVGGSTDAVDLCKLDISRDYVYYLAPIGPKSNRSNKMTQVFGHQRQLKPYVQQSLTVPGHFLYPSAEWTAIKCLWGRPMGIITVSTCHAMAVSFPPVDSTTCFVNSFGSENWLRFGNRARDCDVLLRQLPSASWLSIFFSSISVSQEVQIGWL